MELTADIRKAYAQYSEALSNEEISGTAKTRRTNKLCKLIESAGLPVMATISQLVEEEAQNNFKVK